ncbi:ABC transporter permease, partial [Roseomonas stagni]
MGASLMVAIGAVITPLLLILGLKYGLVEFQRQRLVQDPVYREIRPTQVREFAADFFETIRARPDVAFIIPSILRGASNVGVTAGEARFQLDLLPSVAGDPLLQENGTAAPAEGEVVLSQSAAERLRLERGQTVTISVGRRFQGRNETVAASLRVIGILAARADPLDRIYVALGLAEDIENWRLGTAVASRNWSGSTPVPYASYDGLLAITQRELPPAEETRLQIGTGISRVERLPPASLLDGVPRRADAEQPVGLYRLGAVGTPLQSDSIAALANRLRPFGAILVPIVEQLEAELLTAVGPRRIPVVALSMPDEHAARLGLPPLPWGRTPIAEQFRTAAYVLLSSDLGFASGSSVTLRLSAGGGPALGLPLTVAGLLPPGSPMIISAELAGIVRTAADRPVLMSAELGVPVLARPGYRGFRLYARNIEEVAGLVRHLTDQGLE